MSFCIRLSNLNKYKSLPEYTKGSCCKKAFLHIRYKGSYTLEMAVILPLTAAFFVSVLFFFRVLQVQTQVQEALTYASRKTAAQAGMTTSSSVLFVTAEALCRKELQQHKEYQRYVADHSGGISLLLSEMDGSEIKLRADYEIKLPVAFFAVRGISITQYSTSRKWIGDRELWMNTDYVYVTEHGMVYHCSRNCSYLDLSIRAVDYAQIGALRNRSEHKYNGCDQCVAKKLKLGQVFITDYGTCYHATLSCSGLKRSVYLVPISEVNGMGACSKCGDKKE